MKCEKYWQQEFCFNRCVLYLCGCISHKKKTFGVLCLVWNLFSLNANSVAQLSIGNPEYIEHRFIFFSFAEIVLSALQARFGSLHFVCISTVIQFTVIFISDSFEHKSALNQEVNAYETQRTKFKSINSSEESLCIFFFIVCFFFELKLSSKSGNVHFFFTLKLKPNDKKNATSTNFCHVK